MSTPIRVAVTAALHSLLAATALAASPGQVIVDAGAYERTNAVVYVRANGLLPGSYSLTQGNQTVAMQVDSQGNGAFVVPSLPKGGTAIYTIHTIRLRPQVFTTREGRQLSLGIDQRPRALFYQMEPSDVPSPDIAEVFRHGAHLHAFTPSGKQVTGDYPPDHRWHRGIWLGWTDTEFEGRHPDFWNMGKDNGKLTGEVRYESLGGMWNGPVHGGFLARHVFVDHTGDNEKPVLNETWKVTVYASSIAANVFDLESTQTCAGEAPLKLPKYYYGGLGFRANAQWEAKDVFTVLTSEGETDRVKANDAPCRWVALGGKVDGQPCTITIFCHPANFRAPQPVRVNPKNPQTCIAPSILGDWEITPGKPYVSKYRFVVQDGVADAKELDRMWNDYATPPKARVE